VPNVEEVKLHIAASVDQTRRALVMLRGVSDELDEALNRLRLTAIGTAHPSIVDALGQLEQARLKLDEAQALAQAATTSADSYRAIV
jgi:hypothetical protein